MIVRDFKGNIYKWPPTGHMPHDDEVEHRSSHHLRARDLLRRLFGTQRILEEVPLPGTKLMLDFVVPNQHLIVEVHGKQHYNYIPRFHKSQYGFIQSQARDKQKREWSELNEIDIVELRFDESDEIWQLKLLDPIKPSKQKVRPLEQFKDWIVISTPFNRPYKQNDGYTHRYQHVLCKCKCGNRSILNCYVLLDKDKSKCCVNCSNAQLGELRRTTPLASNNSKICANCKQEKKLSEFYKTKRSKDGYHHQCKRCTSDQKRQTKFGLTKREYEQLILDQGNKCAICQTSLNQLDNKSIHIDHDYNTGQTRGILCHHCNTALGLLKEDASIIKNMMDYIETHKDE